MARCGLVQGIGVTTYENLPANPLYFTQLAIPETVCLPAAKPDIEELLSVAVDTNIISTRLVKTAIGTSVEGQVLSGYKLIIEVRLRQKVKYIANEPTQSVHAAHFEKVLSSIFIVVPATVVIGTQTFAIEELFKQNRLVVTPYIEDVYAVARDERCIFKNITMLVNVKIV
jgi:hypothetical protein